MHMSINEEIANRLKLFRDKQGLSQKALALLCGWKSQSRIGNYELGTRSISADDAIVIAKVLKISPAELLFGYSTEIPVSSEEKNSTDVITESKITPEQQEILDILATLPDKEVNRFLAEMKARKAHFMAMYEEMHKKLQGKAS